MTITKPVRVLAVVAILSMLVGAVAAGPADAKKKKKRKPPACTAFAPVEPQSNSGETAEALEAEIVQVTDAHTEEAPLVIEYEHGAALWETLQQEPIQEDTVFFNFQMAPNLKGEALHIHATWATPSFSDIDLYLYDESGAEVEHSGAFNFLPVPTPVADFSDRGRGGEGFESIPGWATEKCAGYTLESRAFLTPGEAMTLTVYIGAPAE